MNNFFAIFESIFGSYPFLLAISTCSFLLKASLLLFLVIRGMQSSIPKRAWHLLILVLIGGLFNDSSWMLLMSKSLFYPNLDFRIQRFWFRMAWAFAIILYQALALLIEHLADQQQKLNIRQKIFLTISSGLFCIHFTTAIIYIANINRPFYLDRLAEITTLYLLAPLMLSSLYSTIKKLQISTTPRILRKQLSIVINACIIPTMISDFIQCYPFGFFPSYITSSYAIVGVSCTLLTYGLYYSTRKVMGLRFLNMQSHVKSSNWYNFVDDFTALLEQLGYVANLNELGHITQTFFKDSFNIPLNKTRLFIRHNNRTSLIPSFTPDPNAVDAIAENFITFHEEPNVIGSYIQTHKILIYDEISFSNFYQESATQKKILQFLDTINADIFVPIYEKQHIIAYVIVERHARIEEFYNDMERDEMVVFANYLSNIINLLQHRNLETLLAQEKEMKDELYHKHQEINLYKESIQSYLRTNKEKKIGILFYKNQQFSIGNSIAKELITIDVNTQEGHPFARALVALAQEVQEYKAPQTRFAKAPNGSTLVLAAVPNLERNNIIIMVYHPEISDLIRRQIGLLQDPTKWDYLLYLETTQAGALINQLAPSSTETLLNFKIRLLKTALTKQAALLETTEEDLLPIVEILHHISKRTTVHMLELNAPTQATETAPKLFGVNPVLGFDTAQPLFKKLDNTGTLLIKNIHFLDLETQEYLAQYLVYGYYRTFKSEQKLTANVRILASTNQNLQMLTQEGRFSSTLLNELKKNMLIVPSLITLPEPELFALADGYYEYLLQTTELKNLLELTEREKQKIFANRPSSLYELKNKIHFALVQKSRKNNIEQEITFDPAHAITDPELALAARLGKQALKDPKILGMLWNKFKNQNQIAAFLGVNRSSVNRRCKDYNLL